MNSNSRNGNHSGIDLVKHVDVLRVCGGLTILIKEVTERMGKSKEAVIIQKKLNSLVILVNDQLIKMYYEDSEKNKEVLLNKSRRNLSELLYWLNITNDLKLIEDQWIEKAISMSLTLAKDLRKI